MVHSGMNIIIFNLNGIQILEVRDKDSISTELYDYDVMEINVGKKDLKSDGESALFITLQM